MSDETIQTTTPPQNSGGCMRYALVLLLGMGVFAIAGAGALWYFSQTIVDQAVSQPMERLVKSIGIQATPEVRPDPVVIIREVNKLAQLHTAQMEMQNIVEADSGTDSWFGLFEDNLIFVAVGEVQAGIDLAKVTDNDIQATSFQTITIRLPASEIFIATLDNDQSYVADRDVGLGARILEPDPELETLARQSGEQQMLEAALENGILEQADENAKLLMEGLLKSLGFQSVVFIDGDMPPPIPYNPEAPKGFILSPEN